MLGHLSTTENAVDRHSSGSVMILVLTPKQTTPGIILKITGVQCELVFWPCSTFQSHSAPLPWEEGREEGPRGEKDMVAQEQSPSENGVLPERPSRDFLRDTGFPNLLKSSPLCRRFWARLPWIACDHMTWPMPVP